MAMPENLGNEKLFIVYEAIKNEYNNLKAELAECDYRLGNKNEETAIKYHVLKARIEEKESFLMMLETAAKLEG